MSFKVQLSKVTAFDSVVSDEKSIIDLNIVPLVHNVLLLSYAFLDLCDFPTCNSGSFLAP